MSSLKNHKKKSIQQKQKSHLKKMKRREKLIKNGSTISSIRREQRNHQLREKMNNRQSPDLQAAIAEKLGTKPQAETVEG